jgi:hypothetical protein
MPAMQLHTHTDTHPHEHTHDDADGHVHDEIREAAPPTRPSQAVVLDVGEHTGALILMSSARREGLEVEIHLASEPDRRTHVWVLPRQGRQNATSYAAVFPRLQPGIYSVLDPDGTVASSIEVPANRVTYGSWDESC